jgi:hypothetical protein
MIRLVALGVVALGLVGAAPAHAMEPVRHFPNQKTAPGFYKGKPIRYLDLGLVKLAAGNKVAPIWAVTNGSPGQRNIVDVAPGDTGYTPLWRVLMVTWNEDVDRRVLQSAADVRRAQRAGEVTVRRTSMVVNCPILGLGQRQTLGFAKGRTIAYLDLGPVKLAPGNRVAPIWAFSNGAAEQKNIVDVVPGDRAYTPLWRVSMVTWSEGVAPRVLRSAAQVRAAAAAGELTIERTRMVVNCPLV